MIKADVLPLLESLNRHLCYNETSRVREKEFCELGCQGDVAEVRDARQA